MAAAGMHCQPTCPENGGFRGGAGPWDRFMGGVERVGVDMDEGISLKCIRKNNNVFF